MILRSILGAALVALTLGAFSPARAQADYSPARAAYCTDKGGVVQLRRPTYGTNGSQTLKLASERAFCQFTSKKDGSTISALLDTLTTTHPTLAALAYYAEVKYDGSSCHGSPGSCYCSQVGGSDLFGGINAAGGGWVLTSNQTDVLDSCIFPDLSSIDSYGLFYHSANIVRGKDLSKVLAYPNPY
jgi:hypothetical protein